MDSSVLDELYLSYNMEEEDRYETDPELIEQREREGIHYSNPNDESICWTQENPERHLYRWNRYFRYWEEENPNLRGLMTLYEFIDYITLRDERKKIPQPMYGFSRVESDRTLGPLLEGVYISKFGTIHLNSKPYKKNRKEIKIAEKYKKPTKKE